MDINAPDDRIDVGSTRQVSVPADVTFADPRPSETLAITLMVRGWMGVVALPLPSDKRIVLGRFDAETRTYPDIDLTLYDALQLGVSRQHAVLDRSRSYATITDLDSRNGTHLNGVRLNPYELHVLRPGDVICLGKLVLYYG